MTRIVLALALALFAALPAYANQKIIVLTFDDGPREWILKGEYNLLDLLGRENIKATFVEQGWQADERKDLIRELVRRGHLIANHTYGHRSLHEWIKVSGSREKGVEAFLRDAERGREAIGKIAGYTPLFLRPPKWSMEQDVYCELFRRGHVVLMIPGVVRDHDCPQIGGVVSDSRRSKMKIPQEFLDRWNEDAKKSELMQRDVNVEDYNFHEKEPRPETVAKLAARFRRVLKQREAQGLFIHIFALHELPVTVRALEVLIPELKKDGYRFLNLTDVYGIPEAGKGGSR